MAQRCPDGHDITETLADRNRCLVCGMYFTPDGKRAKGGLEWTSRVPDSHRDSAEAAVKASKRQRSK